jgi:hypothetical protein
LLPPAAAIFAASWLAGSLEAVTAKKVTYAIDEDVVRAARVHAARTDRRDSEVVEDALRSYLGLDLLQELWTAAADSPATLDEVVAEQHASRPVKRAGRR